MTGDRLRTDRIAAVRSTPRVAGYGGTSRITPPLRDPATSPDAGEYRFPQRPARRLAGRADRLLRAAAPDQVGDDVREVVAASPGTAAGPVHGVGIRTDSDGSPEGTLS
ncbi:hypothetical protein LY12_003032 [Prauserella alba]|uniref:Uncharacterized protein n=1 Tax=Prauserella alba TaxID=176898 RepID=A0ABN1VBL2_9PSEU|nr:hypothetical protein [Prauserella alba]